MSAKFFNDGFCEDQISFKKFQPFKFNQVFHKSDDDEVKETAQERALVEVASQKWNRGEQIYRPMQKKFMEKVDSIDSEAANEYAAGIANQHTKSAFDGTKGSVATQDIRSGINPNSGRFKGGQAEVSTKEAEATGENIGRSQVAQTEESATGMMNVVALGQGQSTKAQLGIAGLADSAATKSRNDAATAVNEAISKREGIGTVVGGAASYGSNNDWFTDTKTIPDFDSAQSTPDMAGLQGDSGYGYSGLQPRQQYA